jgi:formylglycine-generating enzyme required for sulfatase activity
MRTRRITLFVLAITAILLWTTTTQALTLNMVTIGDPGNPDFDGQGGGSIAATYEIGATEVTVADWVEFLNAADADADNDKGLWGGAMQNNALGGVSKNPGAAEGSRFEVQAGEGNHPINFVNLYDVMRFANWMNNGQGSSDTEDGSYTLLGGKIPTNDTADTPIERNPGATWVIPNYNEWAKAGFYDPRDIADGGVADGGGWYYYANQSSDPPIAEAPPGGANSANYNLAVNALTDVGAYTQSSSYYGTYDQNGNLIEWTDYVSGGGDFASGPWRWKTGGHFGGATSFMTLGAHPNQGPSSAADSLGFRLVKLSAVSGPACDLTGDSSCDLADIDSLAGSGATAINDWLAGAATENGHASAYLPSDSDLDLDVDLTDFNRLASNFNPAGSGAVFSTGDGNGDGSVNLSDYNTLAGSFNPTGYAGATAVPEPTTWVLGLLGLAMLGVFRRLG